MSRLRNVLRSLTERIPRPILYPVVGLAIAAGGYSTVQTLRFEYHYSAAGEALEREAFEEAGEHLAKCMLIKPDSGRACFRAAQTARRSDQPEFAEEQLIVCEELDWSLDAVELERRMLAFQRGDSDPLTEQLLKQCLHPQNIERVLAFEALAKGYVRSYQLIAALDCLDAWLAEQPRSPGARMRRGWVYERLDRFADAENDYRAVLEVRPDDAAAKLRLAQALRHQGEIDEAVRLFDELHAAGGDGPAIEVGRAQCYHALGRQDEARAIYDELSRRFPNEFTIWLEQGKLQLAAGKDADARRALEKAVALRPAEYEPHYQLFLCLKRLGDTEGAEAAERKFKAIEADLKRMSELTEQLQSRPADPKLRFEIAEIFLRRGEDREGSLWLESVVRIQPDHSQARRMLADYYDRMGQPEKARIHRQGRPLRST